MSSTSDTSLERFRARVFARYVSQGSGAHARASEEDHRARLVAYRHFLRGWLPSDRGSWLDLGCGQGSMLRFAQDTAFRRVEGIDVSDEMLDSARAAGLTVHRADARDYLATTKNEWDVISAFDVLEHLTRPEGLELLASIHGALALDGTCILQVPNCASIWGPSVMASDLTHETGYTPFSLRNLALLAGFDEIEFREADPPPTGAISRARHVLWRGLRLGYMAMNLIETGSPGQGPLTRVMFARLRKRR